MPAARDGATDASPPGDLAADHWRTLARTADLVAKLTDLADRYEACDDSDGRGAERRASVALMRGTAAAGRRLVASLTPPPHSSYAQQQASPRQRSDRANARDVRASARDATAEARDVRSGQRDRALRRVVLDLEKHASSYPLTTQLEARQLVRQAQGVLMSRAGLSADEALEALLTVAIPMSPGMAPDPIAVEPPDAERRAR